MSARERHERIERWGAPIIALYLDRGVITEWPFELVRAVDMNFWDKRAAQGADATERLQRS